MTILAPFLAQADRTPDRPALIDRHGRQVTFRELSRRAARLAQAWTGRGIVAGDRVLVAVPVSIALYAALIALWRLGATAVFPEPALGFAGLCQAAEATRPRALCAPRWLRALALTSQMMRRIPMRLSPFEDAAASETRIADSDHPALISFTSGSTGAPKAMARSHALLLAQHAATARLLDPGAQPARDLVWFPVFVLANLGLGITSVLPAARLGRPERANAAHLAEQMRTAGVTRLLAPPAVCALLCETPLALNTIFTGGGPVFPNLLGRLADRFPDTAVHAVYGSTEAEPIADLAAAKLTAEDRQAMLAGGGLLAGRPVPEVRLRLVEDEILVAGPHVNPGYLDPARDAESKSRDADGTVWHHTGDAGRLDRQGRLWLLGRHAARVGGLYPVQAEAAAHTWPGVRQVALVVLDGRGVLAIAGDSTRLVEWGLAARALGDIEVHPVPRIPLDRRHGSKVDYPRLLAMLR